MYMAYQYFPWSRADYIWSVPLLLYTVVLCITYEPCDRAVIAGKIQVFSLPFSARLMFCKIPLKSPGAAYRVHLSWIGLLLCLRQGKDRVRREMVILHKSGWLIYTEMKYAMSWLDASGKILFSWKPDRNWGIRWRQQHTTVVFARLLLEWAVRVGHAVKGYNRLCKFSAARDDDCTGRWLAMGVLCWERDGGHFNAGWSRRMLIFLAVTSPLVWSWRGKSILEIN